MRSACDAVVAALLTVEIFATSHPDSPRSAGSGGGGRSQRLPEDQLLEASPCSPRWFVPTRLVDELVRRGPTGSCSRRVDRGETVVEVRQEARLVA